MGTVTEGGMVNSTGTVKEIADSVTARTGIEGTPPLVEGDGEEVAGELPLAFVSIEACGVANAPLDALRMTVPAAVDT